MFKIIAFRSHGRKGKFVVKYTIIRHKGGKEKFVKHLHNYNNYIRRNVFFMHMVIWLKPVKRCDEPQS